MNYLYWLRRDFRIQDNQCLSLLPSTVRHLDIVHIWPNDFNQWGPQRQSFYKESLSDFNQSLGRFGQTLWIIKKPLVDWLEQNRHRYQGLTFGKSFHFFEKQEEQAVLEKFKGKEILWVDQGTLYAGNELPFSLQEFPKTFSSFRRKIEGKVFKDWVEPRTPIALPSPSLDVEAQPWESFRSDLPESLSHPRFEGGESAALERLQHYLWETRSIETYKQTRNGMIEFDDSSKFSPWLALGCVSPRQIQYEISQYENDVCENESTYWLYFELLWRDYFKFLAEHQGESFFKIEGLQNKTFTYAEPVLCQKTFEEWRLGQTSQPFVNACMRELLETGWLSNRGRQNVASYLAKTLQVPWVWGAKWFEKQLIDYDPESNWGNWAYLAGVGVDPRDRVFNVERQASLYDPEKVYQNLFLKRESEK